MPEHDLVIVLQYESDGTGTEATPSPFGVTTAYMDNDGNYDQSTTYYVRPDTILGEAEESHETIDSLIKKGVMKPYRIPGFPVAGPFWEKYGMSDSEANQPDSADVAAEAETDEFHVLTITHYDPEGNQIAPPVTKEVPACDAYCVGATGDDTYTLTINHVDSDGNSIAPSTTTELKAGNVYSIPSR